MKNVEVIKNVERWCFEDGLQSLDADHEEFESAWRLKSMQRLQREGVFSFAELMEMSRIGFDRAIEKLRTVKQAREFFRKKGLSLHSVVSLETSDDTDDA